MAITVCDLEVPMWWLRYRKASKSRWETILFWRFPQHLSKTLGPVCCLFVCLSFDRMARAVKWFLGNGRGGAMVCKPEPCSLGQAFRAYWTLAREERPSGIRGLHWLEGKEWFPHLCGCRSFITFLSVRWINCMAARLKWQGLWRRQKASQVEWCCLTWEWLRTSLLSPSGG